MNSTDIANIIIGVAGVVVAYYVVPWTKERRDLRKAKKAMTLWLFGKKGVKGISEDIESAPEQMEAMKGDIAGIESAIQMEASSRVTGAAPKVRRSRYRRNRSPFGVGGGLP